MVPKLVFDGPCALLREDEQRIHILVFRRRLQVGVSGSRVAFPWPGSLVNKMDRFSEVFRENVGWRRAISVHAFADVSIDWGMRGPNRDLRKTCEMGRSAVRMLHVRVRPLTSAISPILLE